MQIRVARNSDIKTLVQLDKDTNLTPWSEADYIGCLHNSQHFILILEEHGKIIGCIVCGTVLDEAEILQFWIRRDKQRTGLGKYLLNYLFQQLKQKYRAQQVFLEVRDGNTGAISLYQKAGFKEVGRRDNYYNVDQWQFDAIVMLKEL